LKGWGHYLRFNSEDYAKAIFYYKKAIDLDPNYGRAYAGLGHVYWFAPGGWLDIWWENARIMAHQYLEMAMKNPTPYAHRLAAHINLFLRLHKKAISEAEKALALAPNDPAMHGVMAEVLNFAGRPKEAVKFAKLEMRHDPRLVHFSLWHLGLAHFSMRKYEKAATYFERSFKHNPDFYRVLPSLATTYAHLDRNQEARDALKNYLKKQPHLENLRVLMQFYPFKDLEVADRFADGLLKAGLKGRPSGYYKILDENRLSGEEIKELVFGRRLIIGRYVWRLRGELQDFTKDGEITMHLFSDGPVYDTGKGWIEGDMLCCHWETSLEGLTYCLTVFRNPEEMPEIEDEYIAVTDWGSFTFSVVD